MKTEEDEAFEAMERKVNPSWLFKEMVIGDVVMRFYPTPNGWGLDITNTEFEWFQGLINDSLADRQLCKEPFAHVMVYENDVKHCVTADTKGAIPVYTKEKV